MEAMHIPVLGQEVFHYLAPKSKQGVILDSTLGEGGHALIFLTQTKNTSVIGVDADEQILSAAKENLSQFGNRVQFFHAWSQEFLASYPPSLERPDAIVSDLGISAFHYCKSGRGFSFSADEPLDMRLDASRGIPATEILLHRSEKEIADILYKNAGERFSRRIARAIVQARQKSRLIMASALAELVKQTVPASYRHGRLHPATRTFMALRIEVNNELSGLTKLLEGALNVLKPGGRYGVISFHSLEDAIVKNFFKNKSTACTCPANAVICKCKGYPTVEILTKKGVTPSENEVKRNPPCRSARLRVVEKTREEI
ncbi:MAG: 16S rRNA (cytosine(1402)-N(4))-methyltransferase RsmH [Treponema sp.]|nr:16S rRNA (cytosine(1402)-N(4))-methyltransferase RsmH [Treponema sp.]